MQSPDPGKITTDSIYHPLLNNKDVRLDVLRLDKIHPVISGNKWFKLKYHLDNFNAGNYKGILTFGGAWSNHIVATACVCHLQNINCVGIIRGESPERLSPTLEKAIEFGMRLIFISREEYKRKDSTDYAETTGATFRDYYTIPEGGAGDAGEKGAGEILLYADGNNYTHIICAVGTGTMFNGIRRSMSKDQQLLGIVVLKGWRGSNEHNNAKLLLDYHFGGYAKYTTELISFMNDFYTITNIPTDFVYTGKLAFAILDLIKQNYFEEGSKVLMLHSGGLQGNSSLQKGSLIF